MASQGKRRFKETEIGMIPEDWEVKELKTLCATKGGIQTGPFGSQLHQRDYVIEGTPIITVEHLGENVVLHSNLPRVSDSDKERLRKYLLKEGDIVFSRVGSVDRRAITKKAEEGWLFSGRCLRVRINKEIMNPAFVSYYFGLESFRKRIRSHAVGATMPSLNTNLLSEMKIVIPPLKEQIHVAEILSSLDDKIELNQQMNATLEKIGQAVFKHWFINFEFPDEKGKPYKSSGGEMVDSELGQIPKGWEIKEFDSMFDLTMGLSPKGESYNSDGEGTPLLNGAADFKGDGIFPTKYTTRPTRLNKAGDLIFCIRGTIGNIVIADKKYCLGRGVAAITPKSKEFIEFIYFKLHEKMEELIQKASGSVIIGLSKEDITKQKIIRPHPLILELFHKQMEAAFLKKQLNSHEAEDLKQTRDSLLPRFMSGRIRMGMTQ
jgi:type I restriction enzyme S subunit